MNRRSASARKIFLILLLAVLTVFAAGTGVGRAAAMPKDEIYQKGRQSYLDGDYQAALSYFQEAAKAGNFLAMAEAGHILWYGYAQRMKEDRETEALKWFAKA
jgi:outer membrane protein assembly factor BamD (BamD/ComL family)